MSYYRPMKRGGDSKAEAPAPAPVEVVVQQKEEMEDNFERKFE
jgi:hypothetical protein